MSAKAKPRSQAGPKVSILVPTYRCQADVDRLVRALEAQAGALPTFEVLFIDASEPPLALPETRLDARVLPAPGSGRGEARNLGIAAARGEAFAFVDADCRPRPDWLAKGWARLQAHPEAGLVAGAVVVTVGDPDHPTTAEYLEKLMAFQTRRNVERFHYGVTANLFVPRRAVEAAGTFDVRLHSSEDVDFGNRVHAAGFPLVHAPEVIVAHAARRTARELMRKARRTTGGVVALHRIRHGRPLRRRLLAPLFGLWRLAWALAIPPYTLLRLVQMGRLDRPAKAVPLLGLMWAIQFVRLHERLRLALGGQPAR